MMSIENDYDHFSMFFVAEFILRFPNRTDKCLKNRHGWGRLKLTLTLANVKNTFIVKYSLNYIYNKNIIFRISCKINVFVK